MVAVAVIGLGVFAREPLFWWATTSTVAVDGAHVPGSFSSRRQVRGYQRIKRWDPGVRHGRQVVWYVKTGMIAWEGYAVDGHIARETCYRSNGMVMSQNRPPARPTGMLSSGPDTRLTPPWRWGVTDQTSPSMPAWMKDDAKWAKALEDQGR